MFQTKSSVFTSNGKFLQTSADFQGLKMRGIGPGFDAGLSAMGATTVTLPGSAVYQALATGVIDGAITDVAAGVSRKSYEVQDHFVVTPVLGTYLHGYVNPGWYDGLSERSKAALGTAGAAAADWAVDASVEAAAAAPEELKAEGVQVHIAIDAENEAFKAAMQPAFNEAFAAETGEDGAIVLELVRKLQ